MSLQSVELSRIEADVVIVLHHDDSDQYRVIPFWECEVAPRELPAIATQEALTFVEQCGCGSVDVIIRDFRPVTPPASAPTAAVYNPA